MSANPNLGTRPRRVQTSRRRTPPWADAAATPPDRRSRRGPRADSAVGQHDGDLCAPLLGGPHRGDPQILGDPTGLRLGPAAVVDGALLHGGSAPVADLADGPALRGQGLGRGTGGTGDRAGDYPAYSSPNTESTYDAFEVNSAASMAGASALRFHGQQLTDNAPGDGASPHPINDPASNGWFHVKGTGKLEVMEALSWGGKALFANAKLWIPLGVAYTVLAVLGLFLPGPGAAIGSIGMLLLAPWMVGVALQQTLVKQFTYNDAKAPAYGKTLGRDGAARRAGLYCLHDPAHGARVRRADHHRSDHAAG